MPEGLHSLLRIFTPNKFKPRSHACNPSTIYNRPLDNPQARHRRHKSGHVKRSRNTNDSPIYVIQLSFFTCLFIISLFLMLITLSLAFILFLYTRDTRQSISRQELVWVMRYRKWLEKVIRRSIRRPHRKKRDRHRRHRCVYYIDQSCSPLQKQGCSDSSAKSKDNTTTPEFLSQPQTRDQATQCNDESVYQPQLSTRPVFSATPSLSTKPISAVSSH